MKLKKILIVVFIASNSFSTNFARLVGEDMTSQQKKDIVEYSRILGIDEVRNKINAALQVSNAEKAIEEARHLMLKMRENFDLKTKIIKDILVLDRLGESVLDIEILFEETCARIVNSVDSEGSKNLDAIISDKTAKDFFRTATSVSLKVSESKIDNETTPEKSEFDQNYKAFNANVKSNDVITIPQKPKKRCYLCW